MRRGLRRRRCKNSSIFLPPSFDRFVNERGRRRPFNAFGIDRLGSVTMGDHDERAKLENKLREVRDYLNESALWCTDPTAQSGDWVQFEGNFGYSILNTFKSRIFLMTDTPPTRAPLLLHGGPKNVRLGVSKDVNVIDLTSNPGDLIRISEELAALEPRDQVRENRKFDLGDALSDSAKEDAVLDLYYAMKRRRDGVDYVTGLAKISMVITNPYEDCRLVVARPLLRRIDGAAKVTLQTYLQKSV